MVLQADSLGVLGNMNVNGAVHHDVQGSIMLHGSEGNMEKARSDAPFQD